MSIWFVPRDAAARSMGADAVASALEARGETVIRNGSRGMLWMEPLVERADDRYGPRVGWSNVSAGQIDAGLPDEQSDNFMGAVEEVDYLAKQNRWIYERVGITDPVDPEDYLAHGGLTGLKNALAMSGGDVVQAVTDSGLRGRGGAGFPAGIKWRTVADQPAAPHAGESQKAPAHKYICVNADEGDSGTFADRMLMEGDPFCLLEGMTIAAHAVGADRGHDPHRRRGRQWSCPRASRRGRPPSACGQQTCRCRPHRRSRKCICGRALFATRPRGEPPVDPPPCAT